LDTKRGSARSDQTEGRVSDCPGRYRQFLEEREEERMKANTYIREVEAVFKPSGLSRKSRSGLPRMFINFSVS